ncbi:cellulase family glycosylhydrolase [Methylobacterium sp. NI91]|nr:MULTISPECIES: cellulase family glycosylhydrolase [unclassified Methylobacterium]QIJ73320.1 cellulase family glycosylhydrolase [Methylobacterium sp. CLZ]QIJ78224.1 cellulase family glycosylhydrolase [Methylobacterium sp. NI91]
MIAPAVKPLWLLAIGLLLTILTEPGRAAEQPASKPFVQVSGTHFVVQGKPFFVTGVNSHYLTYASPSEVERLLDDAVALGVNTVRAILQPVIGSLDGSMPTMWKPFDPEGDLNDLNVRGTYLLYWDSRHGRMAINDGPNGMHKVDFLIAEARKRNLRLILAFLDFWSFTGGSQQMRAWYGSQDESSFFFRDPRTQRNYKTWVAHVVQRFNGITGVRYREDPTIFAWELMNEATAKPVTLRLSWTAEMAAYVKSLDPNHLVSSGYSNVESKLSDMAIENIDFGTWHGYPIYYGMSVEKFNETIVEFCKLAPWFGKPVLMEEFGYARSNPDAPQAYALWLDTLTRDPNCAGWLVWRLASKQDDGRFPRDDHDQFDIRKDGSPIWKVLEGAVTQAAARAKGRHEDR